MLFEFGADGQTLPGELWIQGPNVMLGYLNNPEATAETLDADGFLRGLITIKDLQKRTDFPHATKDSEGRLRVAAAIGTGNDVFERAKALIDAGVDAQIQEIARALLGEDHVGAHAHRHD